jgi:uncharacterized protein (TIGR03000 family)
MPESQTSAEAPATIIVTLPAEARLTIDGQATQATSSDRTFVSPPLQQGKSYQYTLKGELDRNGQKVTTSRDVEVRAGQVSRVALQFPAPGSQEKSQ